MLCDMTLQGHGGCSATSPEAGCTPFGPQASSWAQQTASPASGTAGLEDHRSRQSPRADSQGQRPSRCSGRRKRDHCKAEGSGWSPKGRSSEAELDWGDYSVRRTANSCSTNHIYLLESRTVVSSLGLILFRVCGRLIGIDKLPMMVCWLLGDSLSSNLSNCHCSTDKGNLGVLSPS